MKRKIQSIIFRVRKVLRDKSGAGTLEYLLMGVVGVVLGSIVLNSFTGVFSDIIFPALKTIITNMLNVK